MKRFLLMAMATMILAAIPAVAANAGVSVSVGQPGFYGHIEIGNNYPQPQLIYREPIIVERLPAVAQPVYLHVPPGHAKHWKKHCHKYNACSQPVYFVQNDWYVNDYVPQYRKIHADKDKERDHKEYDDQGNNHHGRMKKHGHGK